MALRAVLFDFGGTLVAPLPDPTPAFREAARRAGATLPWPEFLAANEALWQELWPTAPSLVGVVPGFADLVHAEALRRVGYRGPVETLVGLIREEAVSPRWHAPFPEAEAAVRALRARGLSVHLVSNNVDYLPVVLRNLGWGDLFESVTYSQELGAAKPDPRIFRLALQRAGCAPDEALFVGDSWEADYLGATGVGMPALWLHRDGRGSSTGDREVADLTEVLSRLGSLG